MPKRKLAFRLVRVKKFSGMVFFLDFFRGVNLISVADALSKPMREKANTNNLLTSTSFDWSQRYEKGD